MPAISNVVLNDGAATPVAHTFEPAKTTADYAFWEDRDAGVYVGNKKLTFQLRRPSGNSNVGNRHLKATIKLEMPRLETLSNSTVSGIAPAPTVSYRLVAELTFTLPERSSKQERKDLQVMLYNLLGNSTSAGLLQDLAVPY